MAHLITVHRDKETLELHRSKFFGGWKRVKTYRIAVGRAGLETPQGRYRVVNKARSPHLSYQYGTSDWVPAELKGVRIPDGDPRNPIAARWMGLGNPDNPDDPEIAGVGIHGTFDRDSILGDAVGSHGCVRMLPEDIVHLYNHAPKKKTAVFIF